MKTFKVFKQSEEYPMIREAIARRLSHGFLFFKAEGK